LILAGKGEPPGDGINEKGEGLRRQRSGAIGKINPKREKA